jgi:hypothetical protein
MFSELSFSPWLVGPVPLGPVAAQDIMALVLGGAKLFTLWQLGSKKKKKKKQRERERERKETGVQQSSSRVCFR